MGSDSDPEFEKDMNIELLHDTFDEIFEETDLEHYNESELEEHETEVGEYTERWQMPMILKNK